MDGFIYAFQTELMQKDGAVLLGYSSDPTRRMKQYNGNGLAKRYHYKEIARYQVSYQYTVEQNLFVTLESLGIVIEGETAFFGSVTNIVTEYLNSAIKTSVALRFKCDRCDAKFIQRKKFKQHVHNAHIEKMHDCNICKKKFRTPYLVRHHMRVHRVWSQ